MTACDAPRAHFFPPGLYDPPHSVAQAAARELGILLHFLHRTGFPRVGSVRHRSCTACRNGRMGSAVDDLSDLSTDGRSDPSEISTISGGSYSINQDPSYTQKKL